MNYYDEIKKQIINNEITKKIKDYSKNQNDLNTYYNIGKLLVKAGKRYGQGIVKQFSKKLTLELGKGYAQSNLKRFRQFYLLIIKGATLSHQLSWSHYSELIPLNEINIINYYISVIEKQNLSIRQLRDRIKSKEYERLPNKTRTKIIKKANSTIQDLIKNPIIIKNKTNYEIISEKILQKLILENIPDFLKELGNGFTFIDNEYKIKLGDKYNYLDLLLFNIEFNCYVVVELKVTALKKEHIGQIQIYMNYIDNNLRTTNQNKTIGIIICKIDNEFIMEYCSDERIIVKKYKLANN